MKLIEGGIPRYNVLQNGRLMLSSNVYYRRMFWNHVYAHCIVYGLWKVLTWNTAGYICVNTKVLMK